MRVAAGADRAARRTGYSTRVRDPEAALRVERHVHRLVDVRLGGDELDFEARRQMKAFLLLLGRQRIGGADVFGERVGGRECE